MPSISYAITACNEHKELSFLLELLNNHIRSEDEVVIQLDINATKEVEEVCYKYPFFTLVQFSLNNDFASFKNNLKSKCNRDYIFQIDADEYPTDTLLENIDEILESNNNNEAIWLPRLNYFQGVTQQDTMMWGWQLHDGMINFPDYQSRLYKNLSHIRYERRLHEKVEGYKSYVFIPAQKDIALVHEKTIEKQRQTNIKYNQLFTQEENKGYSVK